jgi:hypothetical protein
LSHTYSRILGILGTSVLLAASASAEITYNVDLTIGGGTVNGSIETDGSLGAIGTGNLVSWNLTVNDSHNTYDLTPGDSFLEGGTLDATASELTFDTSTSDRNQFLFFSNDFTAFFCAQDQNQICYEGPPGLGLNADQVANPQPAGNQTITTDGVTLIGTTAAPEPSSMILMITGAGLALIAKRRVSAHRSTTGTR